MDHYIKFLYDRIEKVDAELARVRRSHTEDPVLEDRKRNLEIDLKEAVCSFHETEMARKSVEFGKREFSGSRFEEIQKRLAVPLGVDDVATRQAGGKSTVAYLETFKALEKAQEVFGFDLSLEIKSMPTLMHQQNGKTAMRAVVRATLSNGCFHEDIGVGLSTLPDVAEAMRMAAKAAVSDSIKRTLQHFGPALGSCLKDKDFSADMCATKRAPKPVSWNAASSSSSSAAAASSSVGFKRPLQGLAKEPESKRSESTFQHPVVVTPKDKTSEVTTPDEDELLNEAYLTAMKKYESGRSAPNSV
jgi:DNA recombination protein Rad52